MRLAIRTRVVFGVSRLLTRTGLAPTIEQAALTPLEKRAAMKPPRLFVGRPPAGVSVEERTLHSRDGHELRVRVYRPAGGTGERPGLVYLHGGGWLFGGFAGWEHLCMRLAAGADIIVVALEYRLAPEHHHPTGLHDAMDTLGWVEENAVELGVARDRLGVAGDSAGGNLAAGVALLACRQGAPNLAAQLLVYPALDVTRSSPSARDYRGPGLSVADMEQYSQLYLGDGDPRDELVSPLLADDVAGLPPTLIITAEHDPLRDEGRLYADRLDAAGVRVRHTDYLGYVHGFFSVPRLHPGVEQAWSEVTTWLARTLARPRDPQNKVSSAR